jgi:hypothetical protein
MNVITEVIPTDSLRQKRMRKKIAIASRMKRGFRKFMMTPPDESMIYCGFLDDL